MVGWRGGGGGGARAAAEDCIKRLHKLQAQLFAGLDDVAHLTNPPPASSQERSHVLGAWRQQQQAVKKLQRELSVLFHGIVHEFHQRAVEQLEATGRDNFGDRVAAKQRFLDALQSTLAGVAVGIGEAVDVALHAGERRWKPVRAHVD
jgi:hypothetical protein